MIYNYENKYEPLNFMDISHNKLNNVHKMLYIEALKEYFDKYKDTKYNTCNSFEDFLNKYKIVELQANEYYNPSKVIISSKSFPFTQEKIDLKEYWNKYQFIENHKDISELLVDEETLTDAQLIFVDYVRNRCKFRSKITNKEFWTSLDYINDNTIINEDEMTLKNTFGQMIKNI